MDAIERILCPVDLSDVSRRALEIAVWLGRTLPAAVHVLEVVDASLPPLVSWGGSEPAPSIPDRGSYARELDEFIRAATDGQVVESDIVEGRPATEILSAASRLKTDLIVIGTHGRSGFDRLVLGSVTERVLRKAACSVLAVPPARPGAASSFRQVRQILCPIDFSMESNRALAEAAALAHRFGASLTVVHVLEWSFGDWHADRLPAAIEELGRGLEEEARQQVHDAVRSSAVAPAEIVVVGKPARAILNVAAERAPDLIVMGATGRGAAGVTLLGSTAERVIRQSPCPVLVIGRQPAATELAA